MFHVEHVSYVSRTGLHRTAVVTQPDSTGIHAALLCRTRGIEGAPDRGQKFPVAEELSLPRALSLRTAELELPNVAVAFGDLLRATRFWVLQWDVVGLDLFWGQA